jgi:signal transduction histidine kinase
MELKSILPPMQLIPAIAAWWRRLRLPVKVAAAACVLVLCGMANFAMIMIGNVRDRMVQQSAAAAALYMDSFVGRHVQELSRSSALSEDNRRALERLLSPASIHRPIVAFRVWKGDTIVFSNEHDLIGKAFPRTDTRDRAWEGQVGVELDQRDRDDDEQVRSLRVPILEVYAPVREAGTNRIIALVETYEIAVELEKQVWAGQAVVALGAGAVALMIVLLLLSMASSGMIERRSLIERIRELTRLRAESERRRQQVSSATLHVSAMNERSLQNVGTELSDGPVQQVALALLKFGALEEAVTRAGPVIGDRKKDLDIIREALTGSLVHIRRVAGNFLPADIERLSVADTLLRAARRHEQRSGVPVGVDVGRVPEHLPFPTKAWLYRFVLEGLDRAGPGSGTQPAVTAWCDGSIMSVQIAAGDGREQYQLPVADAPQFRGLQQRIEALGGRFSFAATPGGGLELVAEINVSDLELTDV